MLETNAVPGEKSERLTLGTPGTNVNPEWNYPLQVEKDQIWIRRFRAVIVG
jgi:hypothetical protein